MREVAVLLVALLALGSCGGGAGDVVLLGIDDHLREVEVESGATIEVRLASNASTGFRWRPVQLPDALELLDDRYEEPDTDLVGAPGTQVLTFAAGEGAGILRLEYVRPSDASPVADRVVEYVIRIDGAPWPPDDPGPRPSTSAATATIGVEELPGRAPGPVLVEGFVLIDAQRARLCAVLLESYPPQCGEPAVELVDAALLDVALEEASGVLWTQDRVTVTGVYDGNLLRVTAAED